MLKRYSQSFLLYQYSKNLYVLSAIGTVLISACVLVWRTLNHFSPKCTSSFLSSNNSETRTPEYISMSITVIYSLQSTLYQTFCISSSLNGVQSILFGLPAAFMSTYSTIFLSLVIISLITAYSNICPNKTFNFLRVGVFLPELSTTSGRCDSLISIIRISYIEVHNL